MTTRYDLGKKEAAAQFGLPAPVPGTYADVQREDEQRPKKTRSWLPAALGAAAAGGLGFYALRQRKLLPGAWGKIQEQAGELWEWLSRRNDSTRSFVIC